MGSLRKRVLTGLLLAVLVSGLIAAVALGSDEGSEPVVVETEEAAAPPVSGPYEVSGPGSEQFAVLRSEATTTVAPSTGEPTALDGALSLSLSGQGITEAVPAHEVRVGQFDVTVAEVGENACVAIQALVSCGTPQDAIDGKFIAVELCSPALAADKALILGLVPDGVDSVSISTQGGGSEEAHVVNNVFATIASIPAGFSWGGANSVDVPAAVPPGFSPQQCTS